MNHLGAPLALCLGLAGDGTDHCLVEVDVLDLDVGDLDSPRVGLRVKDLLYVGIQSLAFGEHFVEFVFSENDPQSRLRKLRGGHQEVLDLDDCLLRVDNAEEDYGIDLDRHVVALDHVLWRDIHRHHAQIDAHHLLNAGYNNCLLYTSRCV